MNQHFSSLHPGGGTAYSAPAVDILDIATEKGFAQSTLVDYAPEGFPGGDPDNIDGGDY